MAKEVSSNDKSRKSDSSAKDSRSGGVLGENVNFNRNLQQTLDAGVKDMAEQAQRYKDNPVASQAGFVAESDHCATFNARKALERDSTRAARQPNGNHGDIKIVKNGKTVTEAEVKVYSTAEGTENAMRGYDDQQLVGPKDQVDEIKEIAKRKAAKGGTSDNPVRQKVGEEHKTVAEKSSDSITDGKTKSTERTRKESQTMAKKAGKSKVDHGDVLPSLGESMKTAAESGAKAGAVGGVVIGGGISAISNIKAYADGDKDGAEALADAAVDVGKAAADGAAKGAAGSVATTAAAHAAARVASPVAKSILKSGGPAAIAIGGVETVKHAVDLARGEIDGEEFVEKTAKTVVTTGCGWGGAEAGAALGTAICPGVGTFVGAVFGGISGALLGGSLFD